MQIFKFKLECHGEKKNLFDTFCWVGPRIMMVLCMFPFFLAGCQNKNYAEIPEDSAKEELLKKEIEANQENLVYRGEYLVTAVDCADCHSPERIGQRGSEEIPELKLSGYSRDMELPSIIPAALEEGWILMSADLTATVGPWGVSFAANITSDETGIGNWNFEQFKLAMQDKKFKGIKNGRDLLPPMP